MGYYRGDYRGDWYRGARGDPGLGSFFKGLASTVAGFIPGVGPLVSKGIDLIPTAKKAVSFPGVGSMVKSGVAIVKAHPVLTAAGAAGVGLAGAAAISRGRGGGPAGQGSMRLSHLAKFGVRKRPSMNPCNPRALRRAIRRARSFEKLARRVIGFASPHKPKGRIYFKAHKKKR